MVISEGNGVGEGVEARLFCESFHEGFGLWIM